MKLPNLSFLATVGQLRCIQARYERGPLRNPDTFAAPLLSFPARVGYHVRGLFLRSRLHGDPFYAYLVARTKHYDQVFLDAISEPVRAIANVGTGSDTRAYRFAELLRRQSIAVLECDQAEAIRAKERIVRRRWRADHVSFQPIELNVPGWPALEQWLVERRAGPALVMLEGVSPYVTSSSFEAFLRMLAATLHPQSTLAYDYKVAGVDEQFGKSERTLAPFRLSRSRDDVHAFHRKLGFHARYVETSEELCARALPPGTLPFREDGLVVLGLAEA
ncbi:MAG TPA: class I SAM-dependent methyltransferase [Myxococcota bacterium]|nr:class I SAM-dependent methyltransferase [Myxococcota bacterium]